MILKLINHLCLGIVVICLCIRFLCGSQKGLSNGLNILCCYHGIGWMMGLTGMPAILHPRGDYIRRKGTQHSWQRASQQTSIKWKQVRKHRAEKMDCALRTCRSQGKINALWNWLHCGKSGCYELQGHVRDWFWMVASEHRDGLGIAKHKLIKMTSRKLVYGWKDGARSSYTCLISSF